MNDDEIRWMILDRLYEAYLKDAETYVSKEDLRGAEGVLGLPENVLDRAVKYLWEKGLIDLEQFSGGDFIARLKAHGVDAIEERQRPGPPSIVPTAKRVFVSHSHVDYERAAWIKRDLERYGLKIFVAHKDITPSVEWRQEIVTQIKGCDLFVALLTSSYKDSHWCDQECGIAVANGKPTLPVAIELMPYGFLESFQALLWDPMDIRKNRANLIEAIVSRLPVATESLVEGLATSDSFVEAGKAFEMLLQREDLTDEQIGRVAAACFENDQVEGSSGAQKLLPNFYEKYGKKLPQELRNRMARRVGGKT